MSPRTQALVLPLRVAPRRRREVLTLTSAMVAPIRVPPGYGFLLVEYTNLSKLSGSEVLAGVNLADVVPT